MLFILAIIPYFLTFKYISLLNKHDKEESSEENFRFLIIKLFILIFFYLISCYSFMLLFILSTEFVLSVVLAIPHTMFMSIVFCFILIALVVLSFKRIPKPKINADVKKYYNFLMIFIYIYMSFIYTALLAFYCIASMFGFGKQ